MLDTKKTYYILFFDILFVLLCTVGIFHITEKSNLPFSFTFEKSGIHVKDNSHLANALITKIDGYKINSQDQLEMILDSKFPGEFVSISFTSNGEAHTTNVALVNFYSDFYIITCAILTVVFILIGTIVFLKRPDEIYALIFYWLCVGVAGIISLTWGNYNIGLPGGGIIARIGFHLSYIFTPVIFLHFAYTFPRKIEFLRKFVFGLSYHRGF